MKIERIHIDGKAFDVTTERFDEDINVEEGASYHGFQYTIKGDNLSVSFKKYDDDDEVGYITDADVDKKLIDTLVKAVVGNLNIKIYSLQ